MQVLAGESIPVVVTLSGVDTPFGASRLFAGETLTADWTYTDGAGVTLPPVVFQVASPTSSVEVASMLSATPDATTGVGVLEARFDAADAAAGLVNAEIDPAVVPVQVLREFTFSFATLDGAPIEIITQPDNAGRRATTVQILIGGSRALVLVLDNPGLLGVGEVFILNLVPTLPNGNVSGGQGLEPGDVITLSMDRASNVRPRTVTLGLTGRVELESDGEQVLHTRVVPVSLRVEIVPRRFRLSLSPSNRFSRTERPNQEIPDGTVTQSVHNFITVGDEITIESLAVRVKIRHPRIGDLRVLLASPRGTGDVLLHGQTGSTADNLFETYTSLDHAGLAALVGESAQGQWALLVDNVSGDIGTLEAWSLEINGFVARVLAGGSAAVTASLVAVETPLGTPQLFTNEGLAGVGPDVVEVVLAYDGTGVALSTQMVTFDAESTTVGVTLDALFDATRGTLTAVVVGAISVNAEIAPGALPVEIAPRRFRLSLSGDDQFSRTERPNEAIPDSTGTGTQSVRSVITVRDEITIESLAVRVEIRHPFIGDLRVFLTSPKDGTMALHDETGSSGENLFETYTSLDHAALAALVGAPARGTWELLVGDYRTGGIGTLEAWSLQINTGVQVLAGESIPVVATLSRVNTPFGASRLFAGETLTVDWTYTDGVGVTLSPVVFDVASPTSSIEAASTTERDAGSDRRGTGGDIRCGRRSGQRRNRPCGGAGGDRPACVRTGIRCVSGVGDCGCHDRGGGGAGEPGCADGGRAVAGFVAADDGDSHSA